MPARRRSRQPATTPIGQRAPELPKVRTAWPYYDLDFYVTPDGRESVLQWMRSLAHYKKRELGHALAQQLQTFGPEVCATHWGKQLGKGIFEFRARIQAPEGEVFLRVFAHALGHDRILVLHGYDKGEDPNDRRQNAEIEEARRRLREFELRQRQARTSGNRPESA